MIEILSHPRPAFPPRLPERLTHDPSLCPPFPPPPILRPYFTSSHAHGLCDISEHSPSVPVVFQEKKECCLPTVFSFFRGRASGKIFSLEIPAAVFFFSRLIPEHNITHSYSCCFPFLSHPWALSIPLLRMVLRNMRC